MRNEAVHELEKCINNRMKKHTNTTLLQTPTIINTVRFDRRVNGHRFCTLPFVIARPYPEYYQLLVTV